MVAQKPKFDQIFKFQHSMMAPPSSAETNLNARVDYNLLYLTTSKAFLNSNGLIRLTL